MSEDMEEGFMLYDDNSNDSADSDATYMSIDDRQTGFTDSEAEGSLEPGLDTNELVEEARSPVLERRPQEQLLRSPGLLEGPVEQLSPEMVFHARRNFRVYSYDDSEEEVEQVGAALGEAEQPPLSPQPHTSAHSPSNPRSPTQPTTSAQPHPDPQPHASQPHTSSHPAVSPSPPPAPPELVDLQAEAGGVADAGAGTAAASPPAEDPDVVVMAGPSDAGVNTATAGPSHAADSDSEDEGQTCPICLEPWDNSGEHRLASLKCGHLFGSYCITKWLKGQQGKCPQCNAKATKRDIRVLYAKSLKVLDTSEKERVRKELIAEREARRKVEFEHAQTKLKYELKAQQVLKLQKELQMLRDRLPGNSSTEMTCLQGDAKSSVRLMMHYSNVVSKNGGCRVMAYNEWLTMLVISVTSPVTMFHGFGVKKFNLFDMKLERFIPIHQKQIRDIAFNPAKHDLLLSVGMDKCAKVTNVCSNVMVGAFTAEHPLWSCCWNKDEANQFFVGTTVGSVLLYDTRNTSAAIKTIEVSGSGPAVSMCYVPRQAGGGVTGGGLLVARLQSCSFVSVKQEEHVDYSLPFEGSFTSVAFEPMTRHALLSCRPSQRFPHARHTVFDLQSVNVGSEDNEVVTANTVHTFMGAASQKVLSKSCIIPHPVQEGGALVCAGNESLQSATVWDVGTLAPLQELKCQDTVIDVLPSWCNDNQYISLLTDKSIKFYKWVNIA